MSTRASHNSMYSDSAKCNINFFFFFFGISLSSSHFCSLSVSESAVVKSFGRVYRVAASTVVSWDSFLDALVAKAVVATLTEC